MIEDMWFDTAAADTEFRKKRLKGCLILTPWAWINSSDASHCAAYLRCFSRRSITCSTLISYMH